MVACNDVDWGREAESAPGDFCQIGTLRQSKEDLEEA